MDHLQAMGESTASLNRRLHVGQDTFMAAAAIYKGWVLILLLVSV